MNEIISRGKRFLSAKQDTILSAASVITVMIILSQIFGLIRQWVILKFLGKETFSLFMAAFRLPDLVFEIFAFGAFSAAFIPVFSKLLRKNERIAWDTASRVINVGLIIFGVFALIFGIFSYQFYSVVAFGFGESQTLIVSQVARVIFLAQGLFVVSYVVTGVLESSRRFLVPAMAPVLYNIGIILGTVLFSHSLGIFAPAIGVVIGALMHLVIQLPVAYKLGFRFTSHIIPNDGVKEVGRLALPRFVDLASLQIQKSAELFFSSLVSVASYAYLNLANSLQSIPTMLFGISLAKAALVTLSHQEDSGEFRKTFLSTLNQMMFLVIPVATILFVLRVPIVRLTFGTSQSLDWDATLQIGLVLSSFALGIPLQASLSLLNRAFFARHDTKTPMIMSVIDVVLTLVLEVIFILWLHLPIWSIALANTLAAFVQVTFLYILLAKKIGDGRFASLAPTLKSTVFSVIAGFVMFFTLKFFDRSVWVKKLSFLSGVSLDINFERFVLDTRYTFNLIILTMAVSLLGLGVYFLLTWIFKSKELSSLIGLFARKKSVLPSTGPQESIVPTTTDTQE